MLLGRVGQVNASACDQSTMFHVHVLLKKNISLDNPGQKMVQEEQKLQTNVANRYVVLRALNAAFKGNNNIKREGSSSHPAAKMLQSCSGWSEGCAYCGRNDLPDVAGRKMFLK